MTHWKTHNLDTSYFDRYFVGADKLVKTLQDNAEWLANNAAASYPPFNLKKVEDNKYVIEMAVAGFGKQDLEIELVEDKLIIKGNAAAQFDEATQKSDGEWQWPEFLYQGLANRPFTRSFNLADNVEIRGASLLNGILKIALEAIIPEHKKPKKVEINDEEYPSQAAEFLAEGKTK
jgi:molecular chaperone IbpA